MLPTGCKLAVVGEQDKVTAGEVAAGSSRYHHVRYALPEGIDAFLLGVQGHEPGELQAVDPAQPGQARRPLRALGRAAENHLRRERAQVAHGAQPQPGGRGAGHHQAVLVLGRGGLQNLHIPPGQGPHELVPHRHRVGGGHAGPGLKADQRGPQVLGNHIDQALRHSGLHELTRPEAKLQARRDPGLHQGESVDRSEQLALGEVERRHHDRGAGRAPGRCRGRPAEGAEGAEGEHPEHGERDGRGGNGHRAPAPSRTPPRHGVSSPARPARRLPCPQAGPAATHP
jgi:hypothetical protein